MVCRCLGPCPVSLGASAALSMGIEGQCGWRIGAGKAGTGAGDEGMGWWWRADSGPLGGQRRVGSMVRAGQRESGNHRVAGGRSRVQGIMGMLRRCSCEAAARC